MGFIAILSRQNLEGNVGYLCVLQEDKTQSESTM